MPLANKKGEDPLLAGKAFELSVASELMLRGLECSLPLVDIGVDVIGWSRRGRRIKIQAKGRNFAGRGTGVESTKFSANSYDDPSRRPDFAIIGLRYAECGQEEKQYGRMSYLILTYAEFDRLIRQGRIERKGSEYKVNLNVTFNPKTGLPKRVIIQKHYGARTLGIDVTRHLNRWRKIAP